MIHATEILSRFAANLRYEDIPAQAVMETKFYIADYLAACFAGRRVNGRFSGAVSEIFTDMSGKPEADVLFARERLPAMNAAFMNAVYAHGADMDDGNRKAMGHIGAHVLSAVFALAQTLEVSGKDVITAVTVGYEVYNRVSAAAQPGLVHRGFHSTGTAGAIACGAACAKLLGLGQDGIYHAMALCAVQASGLMLIAESGQACKPLNPANAARTGVFSAKLAAAGIAGSRNPLESEKGWFHAMSDTIDESMIEDGLGSAFTICESYLKPYPSCRHTHCGIEAALRIREKLIAARGAFDAQALRAVRVHIYDNAIRIAGQIQIPATTEDAKFSIHYSLATALARGRFGLEEILVSDIPDDVRSLIGRIELIPDPSMEDRRAGIRGARVEVLMADGAVFDKAVMIPKGDAENPFTREDLIGKMAACMAPDYDQAGVERVLAHVWALDGAERFTSVKMFL